MTPGYPGVTRPPLWFIITFFLSVGLLIGGQLMGCAGSLSTSNVWILFGNVGLGLSLITLNWCERQR